MVLVGPQISKKKPLAGQGGRRSVYCSVKKNIASGWNPIYPVDRYQHSIFQRDTFEGIVCDLTTVDCSLFWWRGFLHPTGLSNCAIARPWSEIRTRKTLEIRWQYLGDFHCQTNFRGPGSDYLFLRHRVSVRSNRLANV